MSATPFVRRAILAALCVLAFAGAAPRSAHALDLEQLFMQVAAANPTLASSREQIEAARRRVGPAGAWQSPMVEFGAVNVPTNGRFDMDPMTMKMIGASQRVPIFGANGLSRRAARENVTGEEASSELAHYEMFALAWEAFADACAATALANHADAHRGLMDRLVKAARARYEAGRGRLDDVLRAEAERARLLVDLANFQAEERGARARLDALRGARPANSIEPLTPPPAAPLSEDAAIWFATVSDFHPKLRAMSAVVANNRLRARAARRMAWPDLELRASYGRREGFEDGMPLDDMFSASVGFMLPLFAGAREFSEGAEMDAMARAAENDRTAARLELEQRLASALADAKAADRVAGLLADTVLVTQERALEASMSAYSAGTTDLSRVFEAAHALYSENIALERARQQQARARAELLSITTRGDLLGVLVPNPNRSVR